MAKFFFLFFPFLLTLTLPVQAGTILDDIRENGVLKVGIREDAVPFGYRNYQGHLSGVCVDFIALLRKRILTEFNQNIISVRLIESNLFNRFRLVEDRVVHIECGPNSIRENLEFDTIFSDYFFVTGTQFLLKKNKRVILI